MKYSADVVVIGSGFSGSIMALVLSRIGKRVIVIDRCKHPRFAIGESSTPIADSYLTEISETFDIPELLPLATFSQAREAYPNLTLGKKRGFSYFWHEEGREFSPGIEHQNELIVAASSSDRVADSHWLRSDIDSFFVSLFEKYGVQFFDETEIQNIERRSNEWHFQCKKSNVDLPNQPKAIAIKADFFIDASGAAGIGLSNLGIQRNLSELKTNTSGIFAHFDALVRWKDLVKTESATEHPFVCDDAAVHHVTKFGWMWQLRFESGTTSCGFAIPEKSKLNFSDNCNKAELLSAMQGLLAKFPSLKRQFATSIAVTPNDGAFFRRRLQHLSDVGSGAGWCALPGTIGFVDPLHSKGIAHSLSGILRLGNLFRDCYSLDQANQSSIEQRCKILTDQFRREVLFVDRLVALCYLSLSDFRLFRLATFWYFAAATNFEMIRAGRVGACSTDKSSLSFLFSDCDAFSRSLAIYEQALSKFDYAETTSENTIEQIEQLAKQLLQPFDLVNLFSPPVHNMYRKTASPEK